MTSGTASTTTARALDLDAVVDDPATRIVICCGSGGVGKTTTAAVVALEGARRGRNAVVVTIDPAKRLANALGLDRLSDIASEMYKARGRPAHMTEEQYLRLMTSGAYLWDHMGEAPVLLVPCLRDRSTPPRETLPPSVQERYAAELAYEQRIRGASIYPAVQNIILACRAFGLGTVITTNHIRCEDEVKELLRLPSDVSTYALMPIGYPQGKFGPLARRPVAEVAYADRWGTAWPT